MIQRHAVACQNTRAFSNIAANLMLDDAIPKFVFIFCSHSKLFGKVHEDTAVSLSVLQLRCNDCLFNDALSRSVV